MDLKKIFDICIDKDATDIFIRINSPLKGRVYSEIVTLDEFVFDERTVFSLVDELLDEEKKNAFRRNRAYEFTVWYKDNWRFRIGLFYQRSTPSMVIRKINLAIPSFSELNLPEFMMKKIAEEKRGLVLFTGITGSGKSTAIASLIEYINCSKRKHILTIEEPIEFTFEDKLSFINQRELGKDVFSYTDALKQFTLHSPDVIYIGNIRDEETCYAALSAAETGILVISTIHTVNATTTVERIINFFPPYQHNFLLGQLSTLLKAAISLRLVPRKDKPGLIPAYEVMSLSPSISRLLRENKLWEIPKYIREGKIYGMNDFNQCLLELVGKGFISTESALLYSDKREELEMEMRNKGYIE